TFPARDQDLLGNPPPTPTSAKGKASPGAGRKSRVGIGKRGVFTIIFAPRFNKIGAGLHPPPFFPPPLPHLFESAQRRQNAAADPRAVFSLRGREDFDFDVFHREPLHLVQQPVAEALAQRRAAREDDVREQALSKVQVRLVDRVDDHLVDALVLLPDQLRVEQDFGGVEALGSELLNVFALPAGSRREHPMVSTVFVSAVGRAPGEGLFPRTFATVAEAC
ncbi:MAG: hypothetical protein BJ554DRAFT_1919, partial [Olpidium bornovanus]